MVRILVAQKQSGALGLRGKVGTLEIPALTLITVFKNIVSKRPDFIQKLFGCQPRAKNKDMGNT